MGTVQCPIFFLSGFKSIYQPDSSSGEATPTVTNDFDRHSPGSAVSAVSSVSVATGFDTAVDTLSITSNTLIEYDTPIGSVFSFGSEYMPYFHN